MGVTPRWQASPNVGDRRGGARPDIVVLHHTAMNTAEAALQRLCDPGPPGDLSPVSCHYLIAEDGRLWQMVREDARAWHAGAGQWGDVVDVNSRSIGVELANPSSHPFPEPQMQVLEALLAEVLARWSIPPERVIGHSDMAPLRKVDPGPRFDWRRLARLGLSVWPDIAPVDPGDGADPSALTADLRRFGYRIPQGATEEAVLGAFRLRFNPAGRGGPTAREAALARALATRFPAAEG
ncbi:N-acetylmuramoyl-L-alanine amidase [Pseudooceanicola aestuarii]|uniref:N-acetylmuramoyl-L-alanine amidase n=1 Tax=Pseudooceanicola aestuarii TaxID=2697319 RepID=UPI001EF826A1|nr:N-acetylmuramoyl-L-alanine amidase [Pseudooceanicola aestuarii]